MNLQVALTQSIAKHIGLQYLSVILQWMFRNHVNLEGLVLLKATSLGRTWIVCISLYIKVQVRSFIGICSSFYNMSFEWEFEFLCVYGWKIHALYRGNFHSSLWTVSSYCHISLFFFYTWFLSYFCWIKSSSNIMVQRITWRVGSILFFFEYFLV